MCAYKRISNKFIFDFCIFVYIDREMIYTNLAFFLLQIFASAHLPVFKFKKGWMTLQCQHSESFIYMDISAYSIDDDNGWTRFSVDFIWLNCYYVMLCLICLTHLTAIAFQNDENSQVCSIAICSVQFFFQIQIVST